MKKLIVITFLLVFTLCITGCQTIFEYAPLSSIVKNETFNDAYVVSVRSDVRLEVEFNDLKEQEFYKNIMNSMAKPTDVLPEEVPSWSLVIKSDNNELKIDNMSDLYAKYNDEWFLIKCSTEDKIALHNYLLVEDENYYKLTIQNEIGLELIGIKEEYKAGEEVVVKLEYDVAIVTYVYLNDEYIGLLNGTNFIEFKMPAKDSVLVLTYTNDSYFNVEVTGSIDLLMEEIKSSYKVGSEIEVKLGVILDADAEVYVNGEKILKTHFDSDYWGYTFIMPNEDVTLEIKVVSSESVYFYLDEFYSQIASLKQEDIIMAKITKQNGLADIAEISYSTDEQDLLNMFYLLKGPMLKATQEEINYAIFSEDIGSLIYEIVTLDSTFSITLYGGLLCINNEYYRFLNQFDDFLNPLPCIENDYYIETPLFATRKFFEFSVTFKDGVKSSVVGLDNIVTNSLQELFNTSYSNEYLIDNYVALYFERIEPISSNQLDDIIYTELFIENGEVYVTKHYKIDQLEGDSAVSYYSELILIPKTWVEKLDSPSNFKVNVNSKFKTLMTYESMIEFKNIYRASEYCPDIQVYYDINILKAYGEYNGAQVVMATYDGAVYTEALWQETIDGVVIQYYNGNRILVCKNSQIYTLTEAYNANILTKDDLTEISFIHLL